MVFHINLKIPVGPNLFNLVSENFRSNPEQAPSRGDKATTDEPV